MKWEKLLQHENVENERMNVFEDFWNFEKFRCMFSQNAASFHSGNQRNFENVNYR